jgi:hypothetical protein
LLVLIGNGPLGVRVGYSLDNLVRILAASQESLEGGLAVFQGERVNVFGEAP